MQHIRLTKLKQMRIEKQITQRTMAELLGVSPQFYSQIERGVNVLSYRNALRIANFLNTNTDYLFKDAYDAQHKQERKEYWDNH